MSEPLDMKAVYEALLPPGSLWQIAPDGDFDHLLDGIGDGAQDVYDFLAPLAHIRDPRETTVLEDLEKEYGLLTDIRLSELTRRTQLAAAKYARPKTGSFDNLQDQLQAAGFDLIVTPNDPAIDPNIIYDDGNGGELVVNGSIYSQRPAYEMQANGSIAFAGNTKAVAGYFLKMRRVFITYAIPDVYWKWRFVFFVGGEASGWPGSPTIASVEVESEREQALKRLILKYKPLHTWCVLVVNYV